jgi:hypothetical protein
MEPDKESCAIIRVGVKKIEYAHGYEAQEEVEIAPFPGGHVLAVDDIGDDEGDYGAV